MQQLNLQLYARTANKDFSEQFSISRTVTLTPDPEHIELRFDVPARQKVVELRLDPDDKPSAFVLHGLAVRSIAGDELYRWDGEAHSLTRLVDLRAAKLNGQVILESSSNDPFMIISLPSPQAAGILVELSIALAIQGDETELADAIRSLQSSVRLAIDDLASEQEGVHDILIVQETQARSERQAINQQLQSVLGRADQVEKSLHKLESNVVGMDAAFAQTVSETTRQLRNEILAEIRDDWRSVRQQVSDSAEVVLKRGRERDGEIVVGIQEEFAKLIQAVHRIAGSEELLKQVRKQLNVARDDEILNKLQRLTTEVQLACDRVRCMERSLSWRLTRPFRILSGSRVEPDRAGAERA